MFNTIKSHTVISIPNQFNTEHHPMTLQLKLLSVIIVASGVVARTPGG